MNKSIMAAALGLAATSGQAQTFFFNGNDLVQMMREYEQAENKAASETISWYDVGTYSGYIIGIADGYTGFCTPADPITRRQPAGIVTKYLKANPQLWHLPASSLVRTALSQAFPCKR